MRRDVLREAIATGVPVDVALEAVTGASSQAWRRLHPAALGGEYLAPRRETEIEIARITIKSTTYDVTSVYARIVGQRLRYRIVDEYDGETLAGPVTRTSLHPLTLGALGKFFTTGWPLTLVLAVNSFKGDPDGAVDFVRGESDYYPQFSAWVDAFAVAWALDRK